MSRERLPKLREGKTWHWELRDDASPMQLDGYLTANCYEDGRLGEIFVKLGESKSDLVQGLLDAWCIGFSIALQHGADFEEMATKFAGMNFRPAGPTDDRIGRVQSIVDYIVKILAREHGSVALLAKLGESG